jgi:hypothetical protein
MEVAMRRASIPISRGIPVGATQKPQQNRPGNTSEPLARGAPRSSDFVGRRLARGMLGSCGDDDLASDSLDRVRARIFGDVRRDDG